MTEDCAICGSETREEEIDPEKKERLMKDSDHLEGEEIHKVVCENCGHTAYVRKN
ncbi:MAG: hypothetical protein MUP66_00945 [Candidatus Nanohaloarchaeota archaeon QJJ-5]|nr:hypothetical protein [Candidatus Nanohaloarchaeota archaeon QJJ-5]